MPSYLELTLLLSIAGSGLIAGVCFAFASFLMRSFDRLGIPEAIRVMQSLNAVILRSTTMAVWFGTLVVGIAAAVLSGGDPMAITAVALYGIAAVLMTGLGNVPLNEALDAVDPHGPEAEQAWRRYRVAWGRWNALRTLLFTLSAVGFALAL